VSALDGSVIVTSGVGTGGRAAVLCVCESSEVDGAPVLARLWCFCCSESDGDRDRLRFESTGSGMANSAILVSYSTGFRSREEMGQMKL
jgi:hypothetical protein